MHHGQTLGMDVTHSVNRCVRKTAVVAVALNGQSVEHAVELGHFLVRKDHIASADVFFQTMQFRSSRNRHDPQTARQHPSQSNLRWRCVLGRSHIADEINDALVSLDVFRIEQRQIATEVRFHELFVGIDRSGQESAPQRTVRNETDVVLLEDIEDTVFFGLAEDHRKFVFNRCKRANSLCTLNRLGADL